MSEPTTIQPAAASPPDDELHRKCDECEKEDKPQRKEEDDEEVHAKLSVNPSGILVQRVEEKEEPVQLRWKKMKYSVNAITARRRKKYIHRFYNG
jgi:hypothetical protein